jgi:predicted transcriptional regulator
MCGEQPDALYLRIPVLNKAVPSEQIDKENTFFVYNTNAVQVITGKFDLTDKKLVTITYNELITLMFTTELMSEETTNLFMGLHQNELIRKKLELPDLCNYPPGQNLIADGAKINDKLNKRHATNKLETVLETALAAEAALEISLKAAREDVRKANDALAGVKRARPADFM